MFVIIVTTASQSIISVSTVRLAWSSLPVRNGSADATSTPLGTWLRRFKVPLRITGM